MQERSGFKQNRQINRPKKKQNRYKKRPKHKKTSQKSRYKQSKYKENRVTIDKKNCYNPTVFVFP